MHEIHPKVEVNYGEGDRIFRLHETEFYFVAPKQRQREFAASLEEAFPGESDGKRVWDILESLCLNCLNYVIHEDFSIRWNRSRSRFGR